jgi:hypothetical protein
MRWVAVAAIIALAGLGDAVAQPPPPGYGRPPPPSYAPIPPPRPETVPPPPGSRYVWEPGHWQWNGRQYVWISGRYIQRPPHHRRWQEGGWVWSPREGRWIWRPAHWG